ncbi:MAG: hypothetical protein K2M86_00525, partial [Odoribacter sp.]|nr:hypothetical protein [Odoribacter sp.]
MFVNFTLNGQMIPESELGNYGFYVIGYYTYVSKREEYPSYETIGNIEISDISGGKATYDEREDDAVSTLIEPAVSVGGVYMGAGLTIYCIDFACSDEWEEIEIVLVNKKSGYCTSSGIIDPAFDEITIDIKDPTQLPPEPAGPTLAVNNTFFCWVADGSYNLEERVESVTEGATVKFYSDEACNNEISSVVVMGNNPSSDKPKEERNYWAKASDANGESEAQKITVTVYQKPDVSLALSSGETAVCYNASITLQATNENGFTPGQYQFARAYNSSTPELLKTSSQDTCIRNVTVATTYYVYVTSGNSVGNCKDTARVDVTVKDVIDANDVKIYVNNSEETGDKTICKGDKVELSVAVDNKYLGKTITYQWSTGVGTGETNIAEATEANITVYPETQTTYNVHVTLDGCTSSTSGASQVIAVNSLPTPTISVDNAPKCAETEVTLTANGADGCSYAWSNDASGRTAASVKVTLKSGINTFGLTATDANGCKGTAPEVTITGAVKPNPTILVDNATPKNSLCSGTEITLTASGAAGCSYAWSNDASGTASQAKATIKEDANNFGLTVRDANGCEGTAQAVAITGLKLPTVTIANVDNVCANSEVSLEATPTWVTSSGATGEWTKGGEKLTTTPSGGKLVATAQVPGGKNTYTINLTDGNGCTASQSVDVTGNV